MFADEVPSARDAIRYLRSLADELEPTLEQAGPDDYDAMTDAIQIEARSLQDEDGMWRPELQLRALNETRHRAELAEQKAQRIERQQVKARERFEELDAKARALRALPAAGRKLEPWPADAPPRYNGSGTPCDVWTGPCLCGAWHYDGK